MSRAGIIASTLIISSFFFSASPRVPSGDEWSIPEVEGSVYNNVPSDHVELDSAQVEPSISFYVNFNNGFHVSFQMRSLSRPTYYGWKHFTYLGGGTRRLYYYTYIGGTIRGSTSFNDPVSRTSGIKKVTVTPKRYGFSFTISDIENSVEKNTTTFQESTNAVDPDWVDASLYYRYQIANYNDGSQFAWFSSSNVPAHPGISALPSSLTDSTVTWWPDGDGTHSSIVSPLRQYIYDPETAYNYTGDVATSTGPLVFNEAGIADATESSVRFVYDLSGGTPTGGVMGAWTAGGRGGGPGSPFPYTFYYNPTTKRWQHSSLDHTTSDSEKDRFTWTYDTTNVSWLNERSQVSWRYDTETKRWTAAVPEFGGSSTQTFEWSYNHETRIWTNHTRTESWAYSDRHVWIKSGSNERWYNDAEKRNHMWRRISGTSYVEPLQAHSSSDHRFFSNTVGNLIWTDEYNTHQTNSYPFGSDRFLLFYNPEPGFIWYDGTASGVYLSYNSTNQQWEGDSFANHVPFYLPPTPIVQHQHIIIAYETLIAQELYSFGLEWENNGRTNSYSLQQTYSAGDETAPLTTTTANTQLLHDLIYNPLYTALGSWQLEDSTNGHTWTFDKATGIWTNTATGYQWQYSDLDPSIWNDSYDGTFWGYNENTSTWQQEVKQEE